METGLITERRRMASQREMLEEIRDGGLAVGRLRGLLYLLVGRRITKGDATVSSGATWRDLAALMKKVRWDREAVRELGLDPAALPPRDREKYWYMAIARAELSSPEAKAQGEELAAALRKLGYAVG
jgi:hypothetical protein